MVRNSFLLETSPTRTRAVALRLAQSAPHFVRPVGISRPTVAGTFLVAKQHRKVFRFLHASKAVCSLGAQYKKPGKSLAFYIVIPVGIEPTSQLPQSCVLSIERRDQCIQAYSLTLVRRTNPYTVILYTIKGILANLIKTQVSP